MVTRGRIVRGVVVAAALVALAGCGSSTTPAASPSPEGSTSTEARSEPVTTTPDPSEPASTPDEAASPTPAASPSTPPSVSTASGSGRIEGTAESVDDVGDADRVPLEDATLAVLPAAEVDALWEAIEFTPDAAQLSTVGGLVDAEVFDTGQLVAVQDGRFALEVDDGDHLVCLLRGTGPHALQGCAEATVAGPAAWRVSTGEGGFSLSTE
ncbi:hypothetical protein [Salsipaludibacter albus]|uniref:hypothetical protein n=1 Tax=Salsipaludibacter albus TaxID=2849650 RepID=UPI001EE3E31F|nr:hypothetical protein [Salsipaludibacter albus]MBY5164116.1 hypothetical protein [Salsipaludibacter albus]